MWTRVKLNLDLILRYNKIEVWLKFKVYRK